MVFLLLAHLSPLTISSSKPIPLFTTPADHPWYHTLSPLALPLPPRSLPDAERKQAAKFAYRYAIHRAGVFHRWEERQDAGEEQQHGMALIGEEDRFHEAPLHTMVDKESYTVNNVLGWHTGLPNVEHVRLPTHPAYQRASTLHARNESVDQVTLGNLLASGSGASTAATTNAAVAASPAATRTRKKAVGFAPSAAQSISSPSVKPQPKQTVHLHETDGLVVVSVFLPVILHRSDGGQWTADWDYEVLLSMQTHLRVTRVGVVKWRGWHGENAEQRGVPIEERHLVEECLAPKNCVPVWVDAEQFGQMYNGFCKGVLWPVLHNVTSVYSDRPEYNDPSGTPHNGSDGGNQLSESNEDMEQGLLHGGRGREAELWGAYTSVNRLFADRVIQCFNEGDLVWIHGFHLLILPSYLTRRIPMAKVGIFLHTPFPSSEIFRTVWCREDLLRGMLNADQVGFHLFEYARHFLTSCRRLLGLNYGMIPDNSGGHTLAIDTAGRHVAITSIHAGVEPPVLKQILAHSSTIDRANQIRRQHPNKIIFCAIDRLESIKGIPLKLLGLERFLQRCPEWADKICLVQVGVQAHERRDDFLRTEAEVNALAQRINEQWPGAVEFTALNETEMRLQQRMALMRASDVVVITSIRDGLNLLPLEFTIAHQDALTELGRKDGRKRGVAILSEFASSTRVMRGALHVNPYKVSEVARAFYLAVNMGEEERLRRLSIASEFVTRVTTQRWALAVMLDLKGVHKNVNPAQFMGAGLGLGFRLLGMDTGFGSLDVNVVAKSYKNSRGRLILLDYGGTIVSNDNVSFRFTFLVMLQPFLTLLYSCSWISSEDSRS